MAARAIDKLLQAAISSQVESVYLEPGHLPRFRRAGTDQEVTQKLLREGSFEDLAAAQSRASFEGAVQQNEILAELVSLRQVSARDARLAAADPGAFLERLRVIDPSGKLVREAAAGV